MIEVESLHHVAVCVTDLDRARHFYGTVLGLPEVARPPFDFGGAWYEFGGRQLHLIVHPPTLTMRRTPAIDARDGHLALRIRDHAAAVAHLRAAGVACLVLPTNPTPWAQIYVADPDGNIIELNSARA